MPASLKVVRSTGATVLLRLCEVCGREASFGYGVSMRRAMQRLEEGDKVGAKRHLGRWYCGEHKNAGFVP